MQSIDWTAEETTARSLSTSAIRNRIDSLIDSLESADAMDRATGEDRGGRYRDSISVLRREIAKREQGNGCCPTCGQSRAETT